MIRPRTRVTLDAIPPGNNLNTFDEPLKSIGKVVLDRKKDIKFHRSAENRVGAQKYAAQHNLLLGPDEDINGDGINDVVLYKKDGTPVMINGYTFVDSEMPYRNEFINQYPSKFDKTRIGGYSGFLKDFRKDAQQLNQFMQAHQGYAKKKVYVQRQPTTYQQLSNIIRENIKTILEINFGGGDRNWIISKFPYMKAIAFLYLDHVLAIMWNHNDLAELKAEICEETRNPDERLLIFKDQLKKGRWKTWYDRTVRSEEFRQAMSDRLQPANMEAFVNEVCGFADANIQMIPTDDEIKESLGQKAAAVGFMDATGERIDRWKDAIIVRVFSDQQ